MDKANIIIREKNKLAVQNRAIADTEDELENLKKINKDGKLNAVNNQLVVKLARQRGIARTTEAYIATLEASK